MNLHDLIAMENETAKKLNAVAERIAEEIRCTHLDGVTTVARNIVIVDSAKMDRDLMCPSSYIQPTQADMVSNRLSNAATATEFVKRLKSMIDNRAVRINGDSVRLSTKTIAILESYLGNIFKENDV